MQKPIIYQLLPRLFSNYTRSPKINGTRKQNGCGKLNDITTQALQGIKELGATHIWYTGLIEHACVEGYPKYGIEDGNPRVIKGKAGSPYAIKDYYDIDPDLAEKPNRRMQEFNELILRTHRENLKVIIDFVPNHVARIYKSDMKPKGVSDFGTDDDTTIHFSTQNDFYYLDEPLQVPEECGTTMDNPRPPYHEEPAKVTGNDKFSAHIDKNDWYETVKLNYGINYSDGNSEHFDPIPSVWEKMKDIIIYWAKKGVDGFRCDMVEMTPVAFWEWLIPQVKEQFPELHFIAEVYNPDKYKDYIERGRFDYLYDKDGLYDTLRNIMQHGHSASSLTQVWRKLDSQLPKMLRFLENHDEQRLASKHFLGNALSALPGMLATATMHTGPVMIYSGQEIGEPADGASGYSGDDGRTTIFDYWTMPEFQKWTNKGKFNEVKLSDWQKALRKQYAKIMEISQHEAVAEGAFYDLMYANNDSEGLDQNYIYAYIRHINTERLLFVLNFNKTDNLQFKLKIPEHTFEVMEISNSAKIFGMEICGEKKEYFKIPKTQLMNEGVHINLTPSSFKIFRLEFGM
ncbi:glycosidase [Balneicella halophila]|uniref:Glycosidase n=1 Tax=Balneicella halophila TaxID=1537566 RepID=A0A7L4UNE9_BALHA|nr:alpha-amylase family protein [Balneicella halophila]PVX49858.1 glycosidase [Balneicella halophila]